MRDVISLHAMFAIINSTVKSNKQLNSALFHIVYQLVAAYIHYDMILLYMYFLGRNTLSTILYLRIN